ncbi:acyl-CoA dehydrogenase [Vibrio sp. UCD-FRSSP16_10]|uniref:acyl-CoA dehydrogenase FadE n=1 Tax=unclassified Vibrio TaxID=2614977 RepID=UPI000800F107|nr:MULTISPECIES: acyl-CoA dehydrogenase FadE [unclassified Vibrio]OBT16899.1 acyl-CoA dehydrogenase [Vibrio sp. UCD-FRSSP16_30]OBT21887.1 acyl-CoA dehydrogenase [Vibrio sp. UCD-FRSSP16_10]
MEIFFALLLLVIVLGACLYHRTSLFSAFISTSVALLIYSIAVEFSIFPWALLLGITAFMKLDTWRQKTVTNKALTLFKSVLPPMSQTEKEALDAGTTWWEAELFQGKPNWQFLKDIPKSTLSTEEKAFLDGPVNELCAMVNDYEITHELADMPPEIWQYLKEHKFFAMIIKKKYGGLEFSAYAQALVLQRLAGTSIVVASTVGVPNSLGPGELLQMYGTQQQRDHYLPRLAKGQEIPCFALTNPEAGSDAGAIPDFGIVCKGQWQGKEVLGMRLTWNKRYITLAPVATVLGLAFKLRDPDGLLGDTKELGITCALIPTNLEGVKIGRRHFPLNIPFQNGPTQANDLFVPLDFIIGGQEMAGQGWKMLVECLSVGRAITLPSTNTGGIKTNALAIGAYARIRRQFKQPIGRMEGIEEPLARIAGSAYLLEGANLLTMGAIDNGAKPSVISAIVKFHCTDLGQKAAIDAMDIAGGKGVMLGPSNFLGRAYQGAPISVTVEGANILTRSLMIYGQGAIRCHPYVLKEMELAYSDKPDALAQFDDALFSHIGFAMSNLSRSLVFSVTDGRGSDSPTKDASKRYYQQLNRYSANLALLSDISMAVLGGSLKRKERLSARLADMLGQLYLCSAMLKRFELDGSPKEDLPLVHWSAQNSLFKIESAMYDFLVNFPNKWIGLKLRVLLMPIGRVRKVPSDKLDSQLAKILQTPSSTRSRLGRNQYFEPSKHCVHGQLELALTVVLQAEPIFNKICKALEQRKPFTRLDLIAEQGLQANIISQEEAEILQEAEQHRLRSINVDDFDPEHLPANATAQKECTASNA